MVDMAALRHVLGGQPSSLSPTFANKSFSDIFAQSEKPLLNVKATRSSHRGEPAISFAQEDLDNLTLPFTFTLVGKFSKERPSMEVIWKFFSGIGSQGDSIDRLT